MPSNEEEDPNIHGGGEDHDEEESDEEDDLVEFEDDDDDDDEEEEEDLAMHQPEDEDLNSASPSTSSFSEDNNNNNHNHNHNHNNTININQNSSALACQTPATTTATIASTGTIVALAASPYSAPNGASVIPQLAITSLSVDHKHQQEAKLPVAAQEKKLAVLDDSRRLFQRLWTDEDEIGLLQGFLEYTRQRGYKNSSYYHDTGPFYDQIKTQLQVDFNKNQLVEKLRRLKKKYRNVITRISSGKDFSFKSPHDQATFEISRQIWNGISGRIGVVEEGGLEEGGGNPQNNNNNTEIHNSNINNGININTSEKKSPNSRKRSRKRPAEDNLSSYQSASSIPNVIEDTVRSCLPPLFKELFHCAIYGHRNTGGFGGMTLNSLPLNLGISSVNTSSGKVLDEKWRKQHILELEVYSKRIELVQDQIKSALEKLRSTVS